DCGLSGGRRDRAESGRPPDRDISSFPRLSEFRQSRIAIGSVCRQPERAERCDHYFFRNVHRQYDSRPDDRRRKRTVEARGGASGFTGPERIAFMLQCAMPVAVYNYLFAEIYKNEPNDVASLVIISTLMSVVTTPILLAVIAK